MLTPQLAVPLDSLELCRKSLGVILPIKVETRYNRVAFELRGTFLHFQGFYRAKINSDVLLDK